MGANEEHLEYEYSIVIKNLEKIIEELNNRDSKFIKISEVLRLLDLTMRGKSL